MEWRWRSQVPGAVLLALAAGVALRAALLALPPLFVTDVYYYNAQAAAYLLRGVDPYGASYSVPPALRTPGAADVFAYLPGVFAFLVPGGLGGGGRAGLVACDLVVAGALVYARPRGGGAMAALYLLLPPVVLFSTAFLNDSLPSAAFLSAALALGSRGRPFSASVLWGLALASSQEAWLAFPVYVAYSARGRAVRYPFVSAGAAAAVVAPFAAWNPGALLSDTLLFQFQRPAVPLLSSGPFGVNVNPTLAGALSGLGAAPPLWLRGGLAAGVLAVAVWRSRDESGLALWSAASVAICMFVIPGDFFWSYLELPLVFALFWGAERVGGETSTLIEAGRGSGPSPR
jgi:hypothetical protein